MFRYCKDEASQRTQAEEDDARFGRGWNAENSKAYRPLGSPDLQLANIHLPKLSAASASRIISSPEHNQKSFINTAADNQENHQLDDNSTVGIDGVNDLEARGMKQESLQPNIFRNCRLTRDDGMKAIQRKVADSNYRIKLAQSGGNLFTTFVLTKYPIGFLVPEIPPGETVKLPYPLPRPLVLKSLHVQNRWWIPPPSLEQQCAGEQLQAKGCCPSLLSS
jgi:hypothetical protein